MSSVDAGMPSGDAPRRGTLFDLRTAINRSALKSIQKQTLLALFHYRNNESCVSLVLEETLALDLSISTRALRSRLRALEQLGVLAIEAEGKRNSYRIEFDRLPAAATPEVQRPKTGSSARRMRKSTSAVATPDTGSSASSTPEVQRRDTGSSASSHYTGTRKELVRELEARPATRSKATDAESVPVPADLDTPEFRTAWLERWLPSRRRRRKPVSCDAAAQSLAKLARHGPDVAIAAIEQSIANDWQGLFPERVNGSPRPPGRSATPIASRLEWADREAP